MYTFYYEPAAFIYAFVHRPLQKKGGRGGGRERRVCAGRRDRKAERDGEEAWEGGGRWEGGEREVVVMVDKIVDISPSLLYLIYQHFLRRINVCACQTMN